MFLLFICEEIYKLIHVLVQGVLGNLWMQYLMAMFNVNLVIFIETIYFA